MSILSKGNPLFTSPSSNLSPDQDSLRFRALVQRIEALERQMAQTVRYGPQPSRPGQIVFGETLVASFIQGPVPTATTGQVVDNFVTQYRKVTDPNGVIRVEQGNLAANGVSPAQWGFRANDATGTPIFDSQGLIAVMKELGHKNNISTPSSYTTNTPTVLSAGGTTASITFSLARQARVLAIYSILGFSAQLVGLVDLFVDGTNKSSVNWPDVGFGANTPLGTGVSYYSEPLAAGSHTIEIRGYVQGTLPGTLTVSTFDLIVWLLGT